MRLLLLLRQSCYYFFKTSQPFFACAAFLQSFAKKGRVLGLLLLLLSACQNHIETYESPTEMTRFFNQFPRHWKLLQKRGNPPTWYLFEPYEGQTTQFFFHPTASSQAEKGASFWEMTWRSGLEHSQLSLQKIERNTQTEEILFYLGTPPHQQILKYQTQSAVPHQTAIWQEITGKTKLLNKTDSLFTADFDKFEVWRESGERILVGKEQGEWIALKGKIEPDYATYAYICLSEQEGQPFFMKGVYFYEKFWRDLYLENALDKNFQRRDSVLDWHLQERAAVDAERVSGIFRGQTDYAYNFRGKWQSVEDSSRVLAFEWREEMLPFRLENHVELFRLPDQTQLCIQYPYLTGIEDSVLLQNFNDSFIAKQIAQWQQEFLAEKAFWKSYGDCQISIDYHVLFANENLISLFFYLRQGKKRTEYFSFNYSLKDKKLLHLDDLFHQESFEERVRLRSKRHVEVEEQRQKTVLAPYDSLTLFNNYNFLPTNLRLMLYSREQNRFFPIYIPYKDLRFYLKKEAYQKLFNRPADLEL
jgi:hypothetical protein